ncbi:hypothetical protein ACFSR7_06150 [Cohnella sp. GCM10020058]|uniref:hypothetical protein n=1 Tax=Cohnella sp. GCM10020058 TaxID=3317330 RepID=UPI00362AA2BD
MSDYIFIKYLIYAAIVGTGFIAAYQMNKLFAVPVMSKEQIIKGIKAQNLRIKNAIDSPTLNEMFANAGHPFKLTGGKFQALRYTLGFLLFMGAGFIFLNRPDIPIFIRLIWLLIPILITFSILSPKRKFMRNLIEIQKDRKDYLRNQELFMLFSILIDEIKESGNAVNILDRLRKLRQYTPSISGSINKGIRNPMLGLDTVMKLIGEDIGTEEAMEVCGIIASLQDVSNENLYDLVRVRDETYISALRASRIKRRKKLANTVNIVVWLPLVIYMMDLLLLFGQMLKAMTENINTLQ